MSMREEESIKAYSERYWKMFNEIDGNFDEVAIKTFKVDLPSEHGLRDRKSTRLNSSHSSPSRMPSSA